MKEATKAIIELALNSDDQIDTEIANFIKMALAGMLPDQGKRPIRDDNEPLLLKMNDAAKKLGVSRVTFWRLVNTGTIKPIEVFEGVFRYSYSDLLTLSQQRAEYRPKARGATNAA